MTTLRLPVRPALLVFGVLLAVMPPATAETVKTPAAAPVHQGSPPRFLVESTTIRLGESMMLPMAIDQPADALLTSEVEVRGAACVEILRDPEIIEGQTLGFCRIRSIKPGTTTLHSKGSTIEITVSDAAPMALFEGMRPRVTSPARGAAVWGMVAIGAEVWVGAPGCDRKTPPAAKLKLPDGSMVDPVEAFPPLDGPFWRFVFELDTGKLEVGEQVLEVHCPSPIPAPESESLLASDPLQVLVVEAKNARPLIAGECEDFLGGDRAERYGNEPPGVGFDASASGSRFVSLPGDRPALVIHPDAPAKGRYQLMARARGTLAASAYPSLQIMTTDQAQRQTTGSLVSTSWRRCAIGTPITLEKGPNMVGVSMANDFRYRNQIDRNAELDSFELMPVPDAGERRDGGEMMAAMMTDTSMMAEMNAAAPSGGNHTTTGKTPLGLRCAFTTLVDGETINGEVDIRGHLFARNLKDDKEFGDIVSTLLVNGKPKAVSKGRSPHFHLFPHDFQQAENTIAIFSTDNKSVGVMSLEQTVYANAPSLPEAALPLGYDHDNYDLYRGGWKNVARREIKPAAPLFGEGAPKAVHRLGDTGADSRPVLIQIPDHIEGKRRIAVQLTSWRSPEPPKETPGEANGQPAVADAAKTVAMPVEIILRQPKAGNPEARTISLGTITPGESWKWHLIADLRMEKGPKSITLQARPDLAEPAARIHACALGAVRLETPKFLDQSAPEVALLYPGQDAAFCSSGDVLVARVFDDTRIESMSVHIDGKPVGLSHQTCPQFGNAG